MRVCLASVSLKKLICFLVYAKRPERAREIRGNGQREWHVLAEFFRDGESVPVKALRFDILLTLEKRAAEVGRAIQRERVVLAKNSALRRMHLAV